MNDKDLHTFGWYAKRISKSLPPESFDPVPLRLLGGLAYVSVSLICFFLIGLNLHFTINLFLSVILGFSFAGLGFLGHEILHGTVVRRPWLRDFLGALAFWPLSTGPQLWRKWHNMNHHVHTQHDEKDPDAWPTLEKLAKSKYFRWVYLLPFPIRATFSFVSLSVQFTLHSIKCLFLYIGEFKVKNKVKVIIQAILPWTTWIVLLFIIGLEKWLFVYLIPLLIANFIVMAYISTNHRLNPITPVNDPLANSLTVTVPRWLDIIHFNFSYHTEHHLFPTMSSKYYPLVKKKVKEFWPERYHEMPMGKALYALWKTPRVYFDHNDLVDPYGKKIFGSLGHGLNPENVTKKDLTLHINGKPQSIEKDNTPPSPPL
ncbi:fatty acid desaturase family protein [Evansella tamaricis]|uniref:Acyl-CoA desaturase n=1 Tax=Evansella tamaricis TaxID=2069301 RepID=A0ABS6JIY2_9BACI|nr:acyl-CoA desaturase [Evansella tamaricis]MBU9713607.1 acyl-CoA desaturase [Evansella tamaricis]